MKKRIGHKFSFFPSQPPSTSNKFGQFPTTEWLASAMNAFKVLNTSIVKSSFEVNHQSVFFFHFRFAICIVYFIQEPHVLTFCLDKKEELYSQMFAIVTRNQTHISPQFWIRIQRSFIWQWNNENKKCEIAENCLSWRNRERERELCVRYCCCGCRCVECVLCWGFTKIEQESR